MTEVQQSCTILANFGGPRNVEEIRSFLTSLLTDQDVVRSGLPSFFHKRLFSYIAKKRVAKVQGEYESMGGRSPIFGDTEALAEQLRSRIEGSVIPFHRYLPETHQSFIEQIETITAPTIQVFPLFPQFTYATTGSIARWFRDHLPYVQVRKLRWIKSYAAHPAFVSAHVASIREFLQQHGIAEQDCMLLFSAHGIPKSFVCTGDIYREECERSVSAIGGHFPQALSKLCFQSKFGPGEWLKPYTIDVAENIEEEAQGKQHVVFVPISFTSDHIETLCEIENDYMEPVRERGLQAYRVPALTLREDWIDAIVQILAENDPCNNQMLVRPASGCACGR